MVLARLQSAVVLGLFLVDICGAHANSYCSQGDGSTPNTNNRGQIYIDAEPLLQPIRPAADTKA